MIITKQNLTESGIKSLTFNANIMQDADGNQIADIMDQAFKTQAAPNDGFQLIDGKRKTDAEFFVQNDGWFVRVEYAYKTDGTKVINKADLMFSILDKDLLTLAKRDPLVASGALYAFDVTKFSDSVAAQASAQAGAPAPSAKETRAAKQAAKKAEKEKRTAARKREEDNTAATPKTQSNGSGIAAADVAPMPIATSASPLATPSSLTSTRIAVSDPAPVSNLSATPVTRASAFLELATPVETVATVSETPVPMNTLIDRERLESVFTGDSTATFMLPEGVTVTGVTGYKLDWEFTQSEYGLLTIVLKRPLAASSKDEDMQFDLQLADGTSAPVTFKVDAAPTDFNSAFDVSDFLATSQRMRERIARSGRGLGSGVTTGGLGTKGRGSGASGYGSGGGNFGSRSEGGIGKPYGDPVIVGALDRSLIDAVVKRNMNQIKYCYQKEMVKNPTLNGKITEKFVIAADGTVSSAKTSSTTMNNPAVESCIDGRFIKFQFPEPTNGEIVTVKYPFVFSPG